LFALLGKELYICDLKLPGAGSLVFLMGKYAAIILSILYYAC